MDRGAWWAAVHGVAKSRARLSDFTFTFHFHALEKEMATYSSVLAWRILGTGEPGGLPSMGLHRVGHDWSDLAAAAALGLGIIGLGITAGIDIGRGGIASSTTFYHTLSKDFTDNIDRVAKSLVALQDQLDSLAEVGFTGEARPTDSWKGRTLPPLKWRMLLLCKPIRNSQGHGPTAEGTNHEKERGTSKFLG